MILLETLCTSKAFSIHSLATKTPTPAVPLLFMDQYSLYLVSLPLIVRQLPPLNMVSWIQQISTFLQDSVSTTSLTLPLSEITLSVPTLRCLLESPQWPGPTLPHTPDRRPSQRCYQQILLFWSPYRFWNIIFPRSPLLADIPSKLSNGIWACTLFPHSGSILCHCPYKERGEIHRQFKH